jgi:plastocyanin
MRKILLSALFACLGVAATAATFTSQASSGWSTPSTWSVVGADADGIPDSNDDVNITPGFTVTLTVANNSCHDFTISGGSLAQANKTLRFYGNCTKTGGTITGTGTWNFYANPGTITGTFTNSGIWYFTSGSNTTIAVGTVVQKAYGVVMLSNSFVTNNGTFRLTSGGLSFNSGTAQWVNAANSTLQVSGNITGSGVLNCSANPNTVIYNGTPVTTIKAQTYHNLTIQSTNPTVPALAGNITVNGNMQLTTTSLNWNSNTINLAGNWTNTANSTGTNIGLLNCVGSGTQTISRGAGNTETFNNIDINGTGTVLLADSLNLLGSMNINGGTFDVSASNYNVHIDGDFVNSAGFNAQQGTFYFDGTNPQNIDGFATTAFYNLTINNAAGVTANFTKQITNILNVVTGAFGPSMFGTVQLTVTNATTYARIAPLGVGASLTGNTWEVQSYVNGPATAYWQYCSAPTTGTTLQDWDGDTRFYMSGIGGNDGNACCPVFYSVRTYAEPTNTYTNITNIATALTPGRGFMIWMADNLSSLTAPLIYDTRGTPNQGNVNRAVTAGGAGGGYNLVGNPYACPINYATVVATSGNLNPNFLVLQENGTYLTSPNGGVIPPGQGFLCSATSSGSIQFTEAAKNITTTPSVIRMIPENQIKIKAGNDVNGLGEEVVIQLDQSGSETFDAYTDLPYIASPYETATHLWTSNSADDRFILNHTSSVEDHLMIPFTVVSSTIGVQSLTFKDLNSVTAYNCAWLEDTENGQRINLNMNDTYTFEESELGVEHKFVLHFERTNDCEQDLQRVDPSLEAQTSVYVNSGNVYAQFGFADESMVTISMYDMNGRAIMGETNMSVSNQTVPLTAPDAHGIYIVRIVKDGEAVSKKFYY